MNKLSLQLIPAFVLASICALEIRAEVTHEQINSVNEIYTVTGEAWQPDGFVNGVSIPAQFIAGHEIEIDGIDDEEAWSRTEEVEVALAFGKVREASVKALYSGDEVFLRVRWPDDDEDRLHRPWIWDKQSGKYVEGPQVEDAILLSFEAGCEWTPSLLGGYIHDFDGWYWLAARTDPVAQALDLRGSVQDDDMPGYDRYESRVTADDWLLKFQDKPGVDDQLHTRWDELQRYYLRQPVTKTLYVWAQPDGIRDPAPYATRLAAPTETPYPHAEAIPVPQYSPVKRTGPAGEVSAKGHWEDGYWTVEFRRVRMTPARTRNDTVFNKLTQFSLHVFDGTEAIDESSESPRLFLQFLQADEHLTAER